MGRGARNNRADEARRDQPVAMARKAFKGPWDWLIGKGMATEEQAQQYEDAIAAGDYAKAQKIEAEANTNHGGVGTEGETASGIRPRRRNN